MPHFRTWDTTYYDFHSSAESGQAHRASSHRQWHPAKHHDTPSGDTFDFDLTSDRAPDPDPIEPSLANADLFEPLQPHPEGLHDDHSSGAEHEIEFDVSAGA